MFTQFNNSPYDLDSIAVHDMDFEQASGAYGNFTYGDYLQELQELEQGRMPMKVVRSTHSTRGDQSTLDWLHNAPLALDPHGAGRHQSLALMLDPNTNFPFHFTTMRGAIPTLQHTLMGFIGMPGHPGHPLIAHPAHFPYRHDIDDITQQAGVGHKNYMTTDKGKENHYPGQKVFPKPVFSYSCLIAMALKSSEEGRLPVSEIYKYMQSRFPYFKTAPDGWKNSVRHNLSLNKAFCKLDRPDGTSQRKGCLWSLKPEKKEQLEREIRKWKKKHPEAIKASMANPDELSPSNNPLDDDLMEYGRIPSPDHTVPVSVLPNTGAVDIEHFQCDDEIKDEPIDELAIENATKELFGTNRLFKDELQPEVFWNELMNTNGMTSQLDGPTNSTIDGEIEDSSLEYIIKVEPKSPLLSSNICSPQDLNQGFNF